MPTKAFDVVTILVALLKLGEKGLRNWNTTNQEQARMFKLFENHYKDIVLVKDIKSDVRLAQPLQIEVTATLDKRVAWREGIAQKTAIQKDGMKYPAFELRNCSVFQVEGFGNAPLLEVETESGDLLYIMMTNRQLEGIDLFERAYNIVSAKKSYHEEYEGNALAKIPMVDFDLKPDIGFMCGASAKKNCDAWNIAEAKQNFKFRMNETGARAVVDVSMMVLGCSVGRVCKKKIIKIDRPFVGWFKQPGVEFPLAVFYADHDCWKESGSLEDM